MAEGMTGEQALRAVERRIAERGGPKDLRELGEPDLTWHSLLDCEVVRSVEKRWEEKREKPGRPSCLDKRPVYRDKADLLARPVDPPPDPAQSQRFLLVREGSVRRVPCECGDGTRPCDGCDGSGRADCAPRVVCKGCGGVESCLACPEEETERSGKRAARAVPARTAGAAEPAKPGRAVRRDAVERVTCVRCNAPESACRHCNGRGSGECPDCYGRGWQTCRKCPKGSGRQVHTPCRGEGYRTAWTRGVIERRPDRRREVLPEKKERPPFPVRWRIRRSGVPRLLCLGQGDRLPEDFDPERRGAVEKMLVARVEGEVDMRAEIRNLPLARVTIDSVPDRVFYVFPGSTGPEVVSVPSRQRIGRLAALTLCAAVLCVLVVLLSV